MHTRTQLDQQLADLVAEWSARPFAWGTSDCCQFARAAAWTLHGISVDAPAYISERDALRTLRLLGGYTGLLRSAGLHPRPCSAARRADIVIVRHAGPGLFAHAMGVVTGTHAHAPTRLGLLAIDRSAWVQCWGPADAASLPHVDPITEPPHRAAAARQEAAHA